MMSGPFRRLPLKLEQRLGEIALQYEQRQRLRGWIRFGGAFVALLLALELALLVLEGTDLPLALPFGLFCLLLGMAWFRWLYLPLRHPISRKQIALFIDERHPELDNLVVSSVEFSRAGYETASDWMVERVLQDSKALTEKVRLPDLVGEGMLKRLAVGGVCLWLAGLAVFGLFLHRWDLDHLGDRFFSWPAVEELTFAVEPGSIRVHRGTDLVVWVRTGALDRSQAIRWRTSQGDWQSSALQPSSSEDLFYFQLGKLQEDTDYQVQVGRRRSEVYRVTVWTPPEVVSIDLAYHYPEYLGLPAKELPNGGHITVPVGTEVELDVEANKALSEAVLVLASGERIGLSEVTSRVWHGGLRVTQDDDYHIELVDLEGEGNEYPGEYRIVAKDDRAPEVRVRFPRGDDEATSVEEISFGFSVRDDYGLKGYGFQYEVAGREPVRLAMNRSEGTVVEAEGEYLLALEDLDLSAGDFLTWTVWAEDGKPGRFESLGDPYFLEIRPFFRSFSEAVSNPGGEGRAGGPPEAANQKQVIIATWNLRKAVKELDEEGFDVRIGAIFEAQQNVLASALEKGPRTAGQQDLIAGLHREVEAVLEALQAAALPLPEEALSRALRHEQAVYRYLLRLQPDRAEVVQGRSTGGWGGGGARQGELDGLELARRKDFQEEASTLKAQQAQTDKVRNRVEELSKRQGFINEDIAGLISEMEGVEGEAFEEAQRKLERLREEQRRNLAALDAISGEIASGDMYPGQARQAQARLEDARGQMARSARNLEEDRLQRARAAGSRALDALNQAREQLQNLSRSAAAERMAELQEEMAEMRSGQTRIVEQTRGRKDREGAPRPQSLAPAEQDEEEIVEAKKELAEAFKTFMDEAGDLAEKSAESQGLMSQKLGDWLRSTSREGIYEDILKGVPYARNGAWDVALGLEEAVEEKLAEAAGRFDEVAGYLVKDDLEGVERALEELQELMAGEGGGVRLGLRNEQPEPAGQGEGNATPGDRRGGPSTSWGPQSPDDLRRFAERGYRDWIDAIRSAEALLPGDHRMRRRLGGIREDIGTLGRRYDRDGKAPRYDLVFDRATKPLTLAAEELKVEVDRLLNEYKFVPADGADVPAQYKDHVAEYFKALSELGGK